MLKAVERVEKEQKKKPSSSGGRSEHSGPYRHRHRCTKGGRLFKERDFAYNRRQRTPLVWMPSPPEMRAEIESVEESLAALPGLEETLDRFQDVGLEERLREKSLLVRLVEEILEGGREAFETRRRKYGF